ncbi:MAG: hypothetical protein HQK49_11900 [Oligoflexia bacterium]|nr:hypothetical protein [Oligoflexia bacterium]
MKKFLGPIICLFSFLFLNFSTSYADNRDNTISFGTVEGTVDRSIEPFVCNVGIKHPYPIIPDLPTTEDKICYFESTKTRCTKSDTINNHNCICTSLSAGRSGDYARYTTKASLPSELRLSSSTDNNYNVIYQNKFGQDIFSVSPITSLRFFFGSELSGVSYFIDVCQPEIAISTSNNSGHELSTYLADIDITPPSALKYIPFVSLRAKFSGNCYKRSSSSYVRNIPVRSITIASAGTTKVTWTQKEDERCVLRYEFVESAIVIREWQLYSSSIEIHNKLPDGHCTYTSGYWMTHAGYFTPNNPTGIVNGTTQPNNFDPTWDLLSNDGPATKFLNSKVDGETWYRVLSNPSAAGPRSVGFYILGQQFIAAHLNYLAGSPLTAVLTEYERAKTLLNEYSSYPTSYIPYVDLEEELKRLGARLDQFNNGVIGPGHCN